MKHIRPATSDDRHAINTLLCEEYRRAPEFTLVNESAILWDGNGKEAMVLSAWDGEMCVATMRADLAMSQDRAAEILGVSIPRRSAAYPALVLTRAATHHEYRRFGLNSALRYHLLSSACGVRSVVGIVYDGAPRSNLLCRIGYRFVTVSDEWSAALHPIRPARLAVLDGWALAEAVRLLSDMAAESLAAFPLSVGASAAERLNSLNFQ
jgi:hypothetical protein